MAKAYHDAFLFKRRMRNEDMWIQGIYNYHALSAVIGTAFGKSKVDYDTKPIDIFPKTKLELEEEKRLERQKVINFLDSWLKKSEMKEK